MWKQTAFAVAGLVVLVFAVGATFVHLRPDEQAQLPGATSARWEHGEPAPFEGAGPGGLGLTCAVCHNDYPLIVVKELGGDFTIDDCGGNMGSNCSDLFTKGYVPGRTYQMRAIIQSPGGIPGLSSWGFEVWVRDSKGATAGTLAGFPNRTTTHTRTHDGMVIASVWNEGVRYRHNGRYDGPVGWRFSWRAPATDIGPVRFFAEGTAADRDRTPHGDYSYYLDGIVINPQPQAR
jgi:hypothetical protein